MSTCDMEKRPIRAQVVLMPSARKDWPNMKRLVPSMGSRPIVEREQAERAPDMRPLTMDLLETPAMIVRPKIPSQNFFRRHEFQRELGKQRGEEIQGNAAEKTVPERAPAGRGERLARLTSVIWYPSIAVAADAGVPGVWMRMAEMEPPKMAPQ